jgi:hypothetical protein
MIFSFNPIFYIFLTFIFFLFFSIIIFRKRKRSRLNRSLDMILFLVKLPRYENSERKDKEEERKMISKMEQIYSNFLYLDRGENFFTKFFKGEKRVVFEIASETGQGDISFYIAVPSDYENSLNKYIQGVYPGAVLEKIVSDYTIFEPKGEVSASYLKLKNTFFLPVNTYEELGRDPLESIVNSISGIKPDEGAGIQIILKPSSFNLRKKGEKLLYEILDKGKNLDESIAGIQSGFINKFFKVLAEILLKKEKQETDLNKKKDLKVDEATIQMIRSKIKKPGFEVNIRLIGVSKEKERSKEILRNLESSFSQFMSGLNGFSFIGLKKKKKIKQMIYDFSFRDFKKNQSILLNSEELTSVYHLPLSHIESPYIKWVRTKEAPPPSELPDDGLNCLGEAVYRGENKEVYIASREDRRRHFYIIGMTGVGKTTLQREMIRQDIEKGEGVAVIDPHGDLIEDTLANIPKERMDDVVLFEPFDRERPCGLNMLEWHTPEQRDFAISEMVTIFSHLFSAEFIGPMFEYYMRNAMAAIAADKDNPGTIVEIPRIFTDNQFMEERLSKVSDFMVRSFWLKEWKQTTGQTRSDMLGYVVSKIGRFVSDEMMRNIIGQSKSGFDLEDIMNNKKIFLANLSKGLTGEINSSLLGLILVSKMQIAALRRARIPEKERSDFYLYIDEFQNFTTNSVATILSEARKYRLSLILGHQYMPQLKEEIKNAVVGNVGTMVSYRIGATDAEFLENQFQPEFSKFDLSNLDNFQYIIKMLVNNKVTSPFKINAPKPTPGNKERADAVRRISKMKYGRPRSIVESEIIERSRLGL